MVTVGDNSYFTGTTWGGDIETGIGRTARMVINFTDSTYANITIIAYDSELASLQVYRLTILTAVIVLELFLMVLCPEQSRLGAI